MTDLQKIKDLLKSMLPGAPVPADVWETADGRRVFIVEMTNAHLINTLLYVKRRARMRLSAFSDMGYTPNHWRNCISKERKVKFEMMEVEAIKRGFADWESKHAVHE